MSFRSFSRPAITRRLFNTPLAVLPSTAAIVLGAVGPRFDVSQLLMHSGGERDIEALVADAASERTKIGARRAMADQAPDLVAGKVLDIDQGVAHINLRGELVAENGGGVTPYSGFTGYDAILNAWTIAQRDPSVKGILADIESPGGEVTDLNELCAVMMADRGKKPTRAIIRGVGASAAYAIAACCDEITVQDLGYSGSIGVITMHADFSAQLEKEGIKVTLIHGGAHKADGNPFQALPDDVRAEIQADIDHAYGRFVAHVAAARSLSEDAVRGTEARVFRGQEGVKMGLADKVMGWRDSQAEFVAKVNGTKAPTKRPGSSARQSQEHTMPETPDNDFSALAGLTTLAIVGTAAQASAIAAALAAADLGGIAVEAAAPLAPSGATADAERTRVLALVDLCAESTVSAPLRAAIEGGQDAGAFAIELQTAAKARGASVADLKAGAVQPDQLPAPGKGTVAGSGADKPKSLLERVQALGHRALPAA